MCHIALHNIIYTDGEMRLKKIVSNSQWEEVGRSKQQEEICINYLDQIVKMQHSGNIYHPYWRVYRDRVLE